MAEEKKFECTSLGDVIGMLEALDDVVGALREAADNRMTRATRRMVEDPAAQEKLANIRETQDVYQWREAWEGGDEEFATVVRKCLDSNRELYTRMSKDGDDEHPMWFVIGSYVTLDDDGTYGWDWASQLDYMSEWCAALAHSYDHIGLDVDDETIMCLGWAIVRLEWDSFAFFDSLDAEMQLKVRRTLATCLKSYTTAVGLIRSLLKA